MDLDAGAVWDFAGEIVGTIRQKQPAQRATVTRIDSEGTVWVKTPGGAEAPAAECGADVRPGDEVTLGFDGARMSVDANVSNPPASSSGVDRVREIAGTAKDIASAVGQHFWFDGNGAHVSTEANDPVGRQNTIWNSLGMLFRRGQNIVLAIVTGSDPGIEIYDGTGNDAENMTASFKADETHLGMSGAGAVYMAKDQFAVDATFEHEEASGMVTDDVHGRMHVLERTTDVDDDAVTTNDHLDFHSHEYVGSDSHQLIDTVELGTELTHEVPIGDDTATETMGRARIEMKTRLQHTETDGTVVESNMALGADRITISDPLDSDSGQGYALTLANPAIDYRYGTAATSASVSVGSSAKSIAHVDLTPGVYIVTGHAVFASNATGRRSLALGVTADTIGGNAGSTCVTVPAASGAATQLMVPLVYSVTSDTTLYLNVQQDSGSTLGVQGQIRYVRIL